MESFFSTPLSSLEDFITGHGYTRVHAQTIYTQVYKHGAVSFKEITGLPQKLYSLLEEKYCFDFLEIAKIQESVDDKTVKLLFKLSDGRTVETVCVPFQKKYTLCLSSQVGCAMKCSFCFTGTQGLTRSLEKKEIILQYMQAYAYIKEKFEGHQAAPNIVFMGQGEPLHNIDNVADAIEILKTKEGMGLGPRQITLSTAGYLPGIKRFSELGNVNFALSFHSPFNEERNELIPLNKAYPIAELIDELKTIKLMKRQFLTFEYLIIRDLNHTRKHVEEIGRLLKGMPVIFNLIPFNEFPGAPYKRPEMAAVEEFKKGLIELGFHAMIRTTKGDDILAACGQLTSQDS
ncbi:23S rRNA (adenine(2503)-C(2))-methyltransferase RlmN [Halobacteriovorax sp. RZ-1]|uniref:23S rRNA (adenine(2503)-C(2))-methyltransferase RlmN n=1 Tax=unclassified Halobacteriovorax TaxID=2639665 RepID=UPI003718BBDB